MSSVSTIPPAKPFRTWKWTPGVPEWFQISLALSDPKCLCFHPSVRILVGTYGGAKKCDVNESLTNPYRICPAVVIHCYTILVATLEPRKKILSMKYWLFNSDPYDSYPPKGPWNKSLNCFFAIKYVTPKNLKDSHWLSQQWFIIIPFNWVVFHPLI